MCENRRGLVDELHTGCRHSQKLMTQGSTNIRRTTFRAALAVCLLTGSVCVPSASAEWRSTGPFGGDAAVVRSIPGVNGGVLAAARNGLLFSSSNGGAFWSNVAFPAQFSGVLHALEVDPRATGTWYVGMEGDRPFASGIYKTTDAGRTWNLLPETKGKAIWSIALFPGNPDIVAAGAADGVYLSRDAGDHWQRNSPAENLDLRPVVSLAFDPSNRAVLYAGTTHLPWRTGDGGSSWKSIHTGMLDDSDVFSIQVDPKNPALIYASACSGVYHSSDGAAHWSKFATPPGAFRTYFVALDPAHEHHIFAGTTEGLLRSDDDGRSWREVSQHAIKAIAFDPFLPERIFFASTTGGILVSSDGGKNLRDSNFGFSNRNFTVLTGAGKVVYANSVYEPGSGGVYRTEDLGLRWSRSGNEPAGHEILSMTAAPDQPATLFAAGYHGLLKSTDAGKTWALQKGFAIPDAGRITALVALSASRLLVASDQALFRATDAGIWKPVTLPGAASGIQALQRSGKATVAALKAREAFASTDAGVTWKRCGDPSSSAVWYGLAFDHLPGSMANAAALAATSEGLFRSYDDCGSWIKVEQGLQAETVAVVLYHPTRPGEAFASQGGRVFHSIDGGDHWLAVDDEGRGASWPSALLVLPSAPEKLFALFPRRGIFSNTVEGPPPAATQ
jgi:photosystem II stability/assembly factor-like uncharacterized protein